MSADDILDQAERLVLKSLSGDREAFESLVRLFHKRLLYFLVRLMGDAERAEDVSQCVWIDVFTKLDTLRSARAFTAWLFQIARHRAYREMRDQQRYRFEQLAEIEDETLTGDERLLEEENILILHRQLDHIVPEHREVLLLRFMEDLSYEEIARITGCGIGTVKSRIHYAKKALAKRLEVELG